MWWAGASTFPPTRGSMRTRTPSATSPHVFTADGPFAELSLKVDGEVETQNTDGVVRGTVERFPPSLFLRDTPLTQADAAIRDFALDIRAVNSGDRLAELHALLHRLHDETICEQDSSQLRRRPRRKHLRASVAPPAI